MKKLKVKFVKLYYAVEIEPREQRKNQQRMKCVPRESIVNEMRTKRINRERKAYQGNQQRMNSSTREVIESPNEKRQTETFLKTVFFSFKRSQNVDI